MLLVVVANVCTRLAKAVPSVKLAIALNIVILLWVAPGARADGDPASDVLPQQDVFFGGAVDLKSKEAAQLDALAGVAARRGYAVKVAVITQIEDMGSVSYLYDDPSNYAEFLASEIAYLTTRRLLVVMRGGYAIVRQGHSNVREQKVLDRLEPPGDDLLGASMNAVIRLAANAGVNLAVSDVQAAPGGIEQASAHSSAPQTAPPPASRTSTAAGDGGTWLFALPLLAVALAATALLGRRARNR
jgi:hypothetical protein